MTTMEEHNDTGRCLEHHDDNCKDHSFITSLDMPREFRDYSDDDNGSNLHSRSKGPY